MGVGSNFKFLLQRRGRLVSLDKEISGSYNTDTGKYTSEKYSYDVKAYFAEYNIGEDNSEVSTGTRWVALSAVDACGYFIPKPDTKDVITYAEDQVTISKVQTIYNGETVICYLCTVME